MTGMVQVTVAGSVDEAEEMATILRAVGIECQLESAVVHDPLGTEDVPTRVLVPESELEAATDALEAFTEPDDLSDRP
jgi:hypothetical protein